MMCTWSVCMSTWVCAPVCECLPECDVCTHDCACLCSVCMAISCMPASSHRPSTGRNHPVLLSHSSNIQMQARRHHTLARTPVSTEAPGPGYGRGRAATTGPPGAMRGTGPVLGVGNIRRTGCCHRLSSCRQITLNNTFLALHGYHCLLCHICEAI